MTRIASPEQIQKASLDDLERTLCTIDGVGEKMKRMILSEIKYRTAMDAQLNSMLRDAAFERDAID